jgi:hypothetical protein
VVSSSPSSCVAARSIAAALTSLRRAAGAVRRMRLARAFGAGRAAGGGDGGLVTYAAGGATGAAGGSSELAGAGAGGEAGTGGGAEGADVAARFRWRPA